VALILVGSYMIRYPLGGNLSWLLQWLYGFHQLGHDVFLVEKSIGWDCYHPSSKMMGNDATAGVRAVAELFDRYGLAGRFIFEDFRGDYYGSTRPELEKLFRAADLFIDIGSHGSWAEFGCMARRQALIDLEPGYNQMRIALELAAGKHWPKYDAYYTNGFAIPRRHPEVPDCGVTWKTVANPIAVDLFPYSDPPVDGAFTTVMNWQAHNPLTYNGTCYGQKDVEFAKFLNLPLRSSARMEIAVSGKFPAEELRAKSWQLQDAEEVSVTFDSYRDYIRSSLGEFSVAKNVFVATRSGWFSDRSNCYLSSGRPVILQETGFSEYLPCGEGLFAVEDEEQAAGAIEQILADPVRHAQRAREIAGDLLDTHVVLAKFLAENGI
jgi:hypothetical protein